jgi:hypothetical protein
MASKPKTNDEPKAEEKKEPEDRATREAREEKEMVGKGGTMIRESPHDYASGASNEPASIRELKEKEK